MINFEISRINLKLLDIFKQIRITFINPPSKKTILFILGCQRSGTTMLTRIFQRDWNTKVFGEFSKLNSDDLIHGIRLNHLDDVAQKLEKINAPLIIIKSLVESQNALKILNHFHNAKVLWAFRHYRDVVNSNIQYFGIENSLKDIKAIAQDENNNWRSENISSRARKIIVKYYSEDLNPYDAATLFWYSRNQLFFDLNLNSNQNVYLSCYDDLVNSPVKKLKEIYRFIGDNFPGNRILANIQTTSVGKGKHIVLSPKIEQLCQDLYKKLETSKMKQRQLFY